MAGSITDVSGITVGHAHDESGGTGVTVIRCDPPAVGALDRRGAATSTRQCDSLSAQHMLSRVDAVVLAGGSAFGLDCAAGVMDELAAAGCGLPTPYRTIPIVPTAALFDVGFKDPEANPTPAMARQAARSAGVEVAEGSAGAGYGATVGKVGGIATAMKGGLGVAGRQRDDGLTVGVLTVVNAWGDIYDHTTGKIVAGARDLDNPGAFLDTAAYLSRGEDRPPSSFENTVLAVVATNARLDKTACHLVARMAQTGLARAIRPCHSPFDGDLVFALSLGERSADVIAVGQIAAELTTESVLRAVRLADGFGVLPDVKTYLKT